MASTLSYLSRIQTNPMLLPPLNLPENIVLLITDTLPSPASFLLHHALVAHIKPSTNSGRKTERRITIISISEDLARWKAISSKFGIDLGQQIDSGTLRFIDVPSLVQPPPPGSSAKAPLRPLFDSVIDSLSPSASNAGGTTDHLVILDDITTLEWIGFPTLDISRFIRALVAACRRVNATLLIRHHLASSDELDDLFRHLLQLCTYHLEVRSLASGRSGAVSGEVALHAGPSTRTNQVNLLPRSSALQYRLTDTGAVYFERGTGAAVL